MRKQLLLLAILCFGGCNKVGEIFFGMCPKKGLVSGVIEYEVEIDKVTQNGFRVDTGGIPIDLNSLDLRMTEIEKCIYDVYFSHPILTRDEVVAGECNIYDIKMKPQINRKCVEIKVVEPVFSKCSNWQHVSKCEGCEPAYADPKLCEAKGLIVTPECPCMYRTATYGDDTIITPPDMYLWEVTRLVTGCNNIWKSPYSVCAML
ncbi:MAG: hypothetical protein Q8P81_03215 [Nanoarchaeota archaeon]|nr:hypothetical protein [Nanoarchaeota archaeon]